MNTMYHPRLVRANTIYKGEKKTMKSAKLKITALVLSCLLLSSSLASCSSKSQNNTSKLPSSQNQTQSQTQKPSTDIDDKDEPTTTQKQPDKIENSNTGSTGNIDLDTYNEKINYYMALVETLQAEIVTIKEENYIEENEYKTKIKELERTVSNLLDRIETIVSGELITPVDPNKQPSGQAPDFEHVTKKNDFEYTLKDGKAIITKYIGTSAAVEIPSRIDGYAITAIGEGAFQNSDVESIIIPSSVRLIDWFAFAGCTSLESITIPSSVTLVEYGAFDYCPKSMQVNCPKGSYIEAYAKSWGMNVNAQ